MFKYMYDITMLDLMHRLTITPFALSIAESRWLFPILETIHVLALTIVVGSIAMIDLRLVGVGNRHRRVSEMLASVLPFTWSAFALAAIAGGMLFVSRAETYYVNAPFRIKMVCMVLAGLNMLFFHRVMLRDLHKWDLGNPPVVARLAGTVSLVLWVTIVAAGRWIGFTT